MLSNGSGDSRVHQRLTNRFDFVGADSAQDGHERARRKGGIEGGVRAHMVMLSKRVMPTTNA